MSLQYLETLKSLAASNSTTWIVPMELSELTRPIGESMRSRRIANEGDGSTGSEGGAEGQSTSS
jgi:hypothetical protein